MFCHQGSCLTSTVPTALRCGVLCNQWHGNDAAPSALKQQAAGLGARMHEKGSELMMQLQCCQPTPDQWERMLGRMRCDMFCIACAPSPCHCLPCCTSAPDPRATNCFGTDESPCCKHIPASESNHEVARKATSKAKTPVFSVP